MANDWLMSFGQRAVRSRAWTTGQRASALAQLLSPLGEVEGWPPGTDPDRGDCLFSPGYPDARSYQRRARTNSATPPGIR